MRQFLQNAIQLQLFKQVRTSSSSCSSKMGAQADAIFLFLMQFIDGRLDLLNSGEGFNDIFEEEINMGEYAGEPPVEPNRAGLYSRFPPPLWEGGWVTNQYLGWILAVAETR